LRRANVEFTDLLVLSQVYFYLLSFRTDSGRLFPTYRLSLPYRTSPLADAVARADANNLLEVGAEWMGSSARTN
jgi:hypothetical protein